MNLTHERLLELLEYDPLTGVFTWKLVDRKNRNKCGIAGTRNGKGYIQITVDRKIYLAHRLAWFYMFQEWPDRLDHEDRHKDHNWVTNLRLASGVQNNGNIQETAGNKTGFRGVAPYGKKFSAYIRHNRKVIYLGMHDTAEAAHEVYKQKHLELHGEFSIYARKEAA